MGERMMGFTFPYGNKDVFVITDRERKTRYLCQLILRKMGLPDGRVNELMYWLQKAVLTKHDGYLTIKGKDFCICDPEELTMIINL